MILKFHPTVKGYVKIFTPADFADLEQFPETSFHQGNDHTAEVPDQIGAYILKTDSRFTQVIPDSHDNAIVMTPTIPKPIAESAKKAEPLTDEIND